MSSNQKELVTIIYYCDSSVELKHQTCLLEKSESGRVVISKELKQGKSIIAVCKGDIEILNKTGDRILSASFVA